MGSNSKRTDASKADLIQTLSDSENEPENEAEINLDEDFQSVLDETFGQEYDNMADGTIQMDQLQSLISIVVKAKRTPTVSQSKQLKDMANDLKIHLARIQAKHLQLQGMYIEQAKTVNNLLNKGLIHT